MKRVLLVDNNVKTFNLAFPIVMYFFTVTM